MDGGDILLQFMKGNIGSVEMCLSGALLGGEARSSAAPEDLQAPNLWGDACKILKSRNVSVSRSRSKSDSSSGKLEEAAGSKLYFHHECINSNLLQLILMPPRLKLLQQRPSGKD
jgi:hypothetical protein